MLRDELKSGTDPLSLKIKKAESLRISDQVAEFKKRGGVVNTVSQGASGLNGGVIFIPECKGATPINNTTAALAAKGRKGAAANRKAKSDSLVEKSFSRKISVRTNITKTLDGKYELNVAGTTPTEFDTLQEAIDERQIRRKDAGLHFRREGD